MHQYAAGRPDQQDERELRSFAEKIFDKIRNADCASVPQIPGNRPYKKAGGAGLVPKADSKKCISCMRCVTKCPEIVNMVLESVEVHDGGLLHFHFLDGTELEIETEE